jgi:hypothetical protein
MLLKVEEKDISGGSDCIIIDPKDYDFCDNPLEDLSEIEKSTCDKVRGPYRYDINHADPEKTTTKCKKNKGAITYECAKDRFNQYYEMKNQTDSGKMRGKLFDAKYNKKTSRILYPGESCSEKYLFNEGVKTFDMWGVDAFPEASCPVYSNDKRVTTQEYSDKYSTELKYGPEAKNILESETEKRLYNQYYKNMSPKNLDSARRKNWENIRKNPSVRKVSPKSDDEFQEYMTERLSDRPKREKRSKKYSLIKSVPDKPIFELEEEESVMEKVRRTPPIVVEPEAPEKIISTPAILHLPKSSPKTKTETPLSVPSIESTPVSSRTKTPKTITRELSLESPSISELSLSDVESELDDIELEEELEDKDLDDLFLQQRTPEFDEYVLDTIQEGIIDVGEYDKYSRLIVLSTGNVRNRVYYLYDAIRDFVYDLPLDKDKVRAEFKNKDELELFMNVYSHDIFDRLHFPYYPVGTYNDSDGLIIYEQI